MLKIGLYPVVESAELHGSAKRFSPSCKSEHKLFIRAFDTTHLCNPGRIFSQNALHRCSSCYHPIQSIASRADCRGTNVHANISWLFHSVKLIKDRCRVRSISKGAAPLIERKWHWDNEGGGEREKLRGKWESWRNTAWWRPSTFSHGKGNLIWRQLVLAGELSLSLVGGLTGISSVSRVICESNRYSFESLFVQIDQSQPESTRV